LNEPLLKDGIGKHAAQGRRKTDCEFERNLVRLELVEHPQKGQIALTDGFKQPVFLKETGVFGMTYKWKMGIQDEYNGIGRH